jgi:hypothetical protein
MGMTFGEQKYYVIVNKRGDLIDTIMPGELKNYIPYSLREISLHEFMNDEWIRRPRTKLYKEIQARQPLRIVASYRVEPQEGTNPEEGDSSWLM